MKKLILTLAIGLSLLTFTSCKKNNPKPLTPTKSEVVIETRFVTEDTVQIGTFYALQFGINETENWCQHLFVSPCGQWGINTEFYSNASRRVEIYKNNNTQSAVWIGEIQINPTDSSFIITEILGPNVNLVPIECDGLTRLQIQE